MAEPKPVRMVRCVYVRENDGWVPMGRSRTRCPRCGAEVKDEGDPSPFHVVELRRDES